MWKIVKQILSLWVCSLLDNEEKTVEVADMLQTLEQQKYFQTTTYTVRKKQRKVITAVVIHQISSLSLLHCSSLFPFPSVSILLFSSLQPRHIYVSTPVSSTCPSPTPPLPCSFFSLFLTSVLLFLFLFYLKIAIHLCNHSMFSPPLQFFCLELGQLKATEEEKKQKQDRVCESPLQQKAGNEKKKWDDATRGDGDWK